MKTKIILSLLIGSILFSCQNTNKESGHNEESEEHHHHGPEGVVILNGAQREALDLKVDTFMMRNLTTVIKTNGQLEVPPSGSAEVTAFIGGNVKKINVFHGDKVRKGQVLAVLEHPDYISLQEDFAEIANRVEFLEKEYERQKKLFENNVGAGKDYQQIKADYKTAKSKYEGLKSRLKLLNISPDDVTSGIISNSINVLAPINGYVKDITIKVGTYVGAQDKLFEITDNSQIHADFMVYEKDIRLLKVGQNVHFTVANYPAKEYTATIFAIGKEFESNTRAVHIHASLDKNEPDLIPGMYVTGHIHTNNHYARALPNDAIVTEGTKSFIFVVNNSTFDEEHGHEHEHEHNNGEETSAEEEHEHEQEEGHNHPMAFRMVEIITGQKDEHYTEVKLLDELPENTRVVMNAAYYLMADLNKEETEHHH